jgi:hypothetical protein
MIFACCVAAMLSCAATAAHAAAITNMDTIPYDLRVQLAGTEDEISIEPGDTWRSEAHPVNVRYKNNWLRLDPGDDYAIWKGGVLLKQRRGSMLGTSH